ncbi:MAG: hypothetical protein LBI11_01995 [Streptococcaceae bacterium]|jgi:GH25 family lysozyme M1 (1,4-beta-N-acetylmuramidase)|nr:hypothetical protein [Streptococcaceae bacterium]
MKKISFLPFILFLSALTTPFAASADGIPTLTAGQGGIPRTDVVDVSSWQGNISVASYQAMKNAGAKGVIVKLTESTDYTNPYAATQLANAKAAGLQVGAYHYAHFTSTASAQAEANFFASQAKSLSLPSTTVMVDDLEDSSTTGHNPQANATAFAAQLKANGYAKTLLYTFPTYVASQGLNLSAFGNSNIWMAQYPYTPSASNLWNTQYGMWQFNSDTHFSGVSGGFDVSIDYANIMSAADSSVPAGTGYIYRLFSPITNEHLYTKDRYEAQVLSSSGWNYEGVNWVAPTSGKPIYRMYNPAIRQHLYTTDLNEYTTNAKVGWNKEGIAFYSGGSIPIYRAYSPVLKVHLWTTSGYEIKVITATPAWKNEGTAFYAQTLYSASKTAATLPSVSASSASSTSVLPPSSSTATSSSTSSSSSTSALPSSSSTIASSSNTSSTSSTK